MCSLICVSPNIIIIPLFLKSYSGKAAVVGVGLAANGGKGGARPCRGGT